MTAAIIVYSLMIYARVEPMIGPSSEIIVKNIATQSACDVLGKQMIKTAYQGFLYTCIPTTRINQSQSTPKKTAK